jgi:hypothetical protein
MEERRGDSEMALLECKRKSSQGLSRGRKIGAELRRGLEKTGLAHKCGHVVGFQ